MDAIVRSIQQFNYIRACTIGFFICVAFYVFQKMLLILANVIGPLQIITPQVIVTILNILHASFFVFLLISAPVLYFRKSEYDIKQALILSIVLIFCASILIWAQNMILTLLDDEGITHGGSLDIAGLAMFLFIPVIALSILKFTSKH